MNWHWLHEQRTALKTFKPVQVPSEQNYADMMTKPLPMATLQKFVKGLRLCDDTDLPDVVIGCEDKDGKVLHYATDPMHFSY